MARTQHGDSLMSRTVRIVESFRPGEQWVSTTELARRTGLHLATASRLIAELVGHGWLERGPDRRVRLGVRLWEVASRASTMASLRETALPVLEGLHADVGHHVQLGVLQGDEVLFLERLSAPDAVINYTRVAGRLSIHASSAGLVLLAYADRALQDVVLNRALPRFTPTTPTGPGQLRRILAGIRQQGSVVCPGYFHPDAMGIAAPVLVARRAVAAVSIVVPHDDRSSRLVGRVSLAAAEISRKVEASEPKSH